jgi:hypothetical protein
MRTSPSPTNQRPIKFGDVVTLAPGALTSLLASCPPGSCHYDPFAARGWNRFPIQRHRRRSGLVSLSQQLALSLLLSVNGINHNGLHSGRCCNCVVGPRVHADMRPAGRHGRECPPRPTRQAGNCPRSFSRPKSWSKSIIARLLSAATKSSAWTFTATTRARAQLTQVQPRNSCRAAGVVHCDNRTRGPCTQCTQCTAWRTWWVTVAGRSARRKQPGAARGQLFRTAGHVVRTQHGVTASAGQRHCDVEIRTIFGIKPGTAWSLTSASPTTGLGQAATSPLTHPQDIDVPLRIALQRKITVARCQWGHGRRLICFQKRPKMSAVLFRKYRKSPCKSP